MADNQDNSIDPSAVTLVDGVPYSKRYNDIYYHRESGLAESEAVFLVGADIESNWADRKHFCIGETGFGTGLNFLVTWSAWQNARNRAQRLTFFSFDHTPLRPDLLQSSHRQVGAPAGLSSALIDAYPPATPGMHVRQFEQGTLTLVLFFGEAMDALNSITSPMDAWYLDGFSPSTNEDMWQGPLLHRVGQLTKQGGRIATFTAAGAVRRALDLAGFDVERVKGFGNKRHRTIGVKRTEAEPKQAPRTAQQWSFPALDLKKRPSNHRIAIIGAGIAGLTLAHALKMRGIDPTLFDDPETRAGSSVPVAMIAPKLPADTIQPRAQLIARAYAHAVSYSPYRAHFLAPLGITLRDSKPDTTHGHSYKKMVAAHPWGDAWWQQRNKDIFAANTGALNTAPLLASLREGLNLIHTRITNLNQRGDSWILEGEGNTFKCDTVILATAAPDLLPSYLHSSLTSTPGRTVTVSAKDSNHLGDSAFLSSGYASPPFVENSKLVRLLGATREADLILDNAEQDLSPLRVLVEKLGLPFSAIESGSQWAGHRFETSDHLPLVGPLWRDQSIEDYLAPLRKDARASLGPPPIRKGFYCFTGFGSKGYQYSPYLAEVMSAALTSEVHGYDRSIWPSLYPMRYTIRQFIRQK